MNGHVVAVDPGTTKSGFVMMSREGTVFVAEPECDNDLMVDTLRTLVGVSHVVIEKAEPLGMAVSADMFDTILWTGRFWQAALSPMLEAVAPRVTLIGRKAVKVSLCGTTQAKDPNIRQRIIDLYGGANAIGVRKNPGPLYGVKSHAWAALAVGLVHLDNLAGVSKTGENWKYPFPVRP